METIFTENPLFSQFTFYTMLLILNCMLLSLYTIRLRVKRKVFSNPEDCSGILSPRQHIGPKFDDPYVERVRRCHRNDLENVIPFILVGIFYVLSKPDQTVAIWHFRAFVLFRILYTIAYLYPIPQPARTGTYGLGFLTTLSMVLHVLQMTSA